MLPELDQLVDLRTGLVGNAILSDEEIHRRELERVFARSWLFVAHESMLPNNGDYIANRMGEDAVIVCRDPQGKVRVFLNKCRHRGNKVCLFDRGNTSAFTCSYHGWTYSTSGALTGVPFHDEAYSGGLDKERLGLLEVPRVESYGGLIFASWDPGVLALDDYLGDLRWYLDHLLVAEDLGGLEVVPGRSRYLIPGNWKLLAENFAGDEYHFYSTHASVGKLRAAQPGSSRAAVREFEVATGYSFGVPHGLCVLIGDEIYEQERRAAEPLGQEAVEWVEERHRRLRERLGNGAPNLAGFTHLNVFPNFSVIGGSLIRTALIGRGLIQWHPRGPGVTEVWQWGAVERDAPAAVKKMAITALTHGQSAAGLIAPDDHENFERIAENVRTGVAQTVPFHYAMGLGREDTDPSREDGALAGLPGLVAPRFTELNQRQFFRYWLHLMSEA